MFYVIDTLKNKPYGDFETMQQAINFQMQFSGKIPYSKIITKGEPGFNKINQKIAYDNYDSLTNPYCMD